MSDLREQIAEIFDIRARNIVAWERSQEDLITEYQWADAILALLPKPTVRVKCQECGGSGSAWDMAMIPPHQEPQQVEGPCPSCTDGWNEHLIEWEWDASSGMNPFTRKDLELSRLLDTDMAETFISLKRTYIAHIAEGGSMEWQIPHNKGTLRIGEKV